MEFYLVDDLECDLVVFHPYRTLMTLCVKEGDSSIGDIDEFKSDRPRYWGTGEGHLPCLEAIILAFLNTPLSLTLVLDPNSRASLHLTPLSDESSCNNQSSSQSSSTSTAPTRRSSRSTASSPKRQKTPDIVEFMAGLNVNMSLVATIVQEMISLYTLWERYKDDGSDPTSAPFGGTNHFSSLPGHRRGATARSGSVMSGGTLSTAGTPNTSEDMHHHTMHQTHGHIVNPGYLSRLLLKMREAKMVDIGHGPGSGNPRLTAHNKRLDRAQTAG
ncbi:hypothetical protein NLI96_g7096 [Meripilus lineatus]|uniref:Uncharacterized protein n=1 Tax=Meripilus lineatus TaxID=2056292 RepID=A0AAD5V521_9APHY|nr:hypothetical protein NLI96_g7096 [Physisporinus lineatus]